jgi:hypothetical protein
VEVYTFWVDTVHDLIFSNNTTVNSAYVNLVTIGQTGQDYASDTGATAANNGLVSAEESAGRRLSGNVGP